MAVGKDAFDEQTYAKLMRIALRAQPQCRATLETLAAVKNPSSVAFVRQANIAHGPQQVNNEMVARAQENEISQKNVLETPHGEWLDIGAPRVPSAAHVP